MSNMHFQFTVNAEIEREEGKFASRGEMEEQLVEEIASFDLGPLEGENGGIYNVVEWNVEPAEKGA